MKFSFTMLNLMLVALTQVERAESKFFLADTEDANTGQPRIPKIRGHRNLFRSFWWRGIGECIADIEYRSDTTRYAKYFEDENGIWGYVYQSKFLCETGMYPYFIRNYTEDALLFEKEYYLEGLFEDFPGAVLLQSSRFIAGAATFRVPCDSPPQTLSVLFEDRLNKCIEDGTGEWVLAESDYSTKVILTYYDNEECSGDPSQMMELGRECLFLRRGSISEHVFRDQAPEDTMIISSAPILSLSCWICLFCLIVCKRLVI
jgi:hypothetical protein